MTLMYLLLVGTLGQVETIGLRELNQNPSRAVARVRAGESLLVTDRGKPILRSLGEVGSQPATRKPRPQYDKTSLHFRRAACGDR